MTPETYTKLAARTDAPLTAELIHRLTNPQTIELLHATLGMVTEAAELADMLKKHIFANKPLDLVNASEEIGDELWYAAKAIRAIQSDMKTVMTQNIAKLEKRYPEKYFCEQASAKRNVVQERKILEAPIKIHCSVDHELMERGIDMPLAHDDDKDTEVKSLRGKDFHDFSQRVLQHIENYTVPQYGDKGMDQATSYTASDCVKQAKKYLDRFGKNSRPGQEILDFKKAIHYCQMAATKLEEGKYYVTD